MISTTNSLLLLLIALLIVSSYSQTVIEDDFSDELTFTADEYKDFRFRGTGEEEDAFFGHLKILITTEEDHKIADIYFGGATYPEGDEEDHPDAITSPTKDENYGWERFNAMKAYNNAEIIYFSIHSPTGGTFDINIEAVPVITLNPDQEGGEEYSFTTRPHWEREFWIETTAESALEIYLTTPGETFGDFFSTYSTNSSTFMGATLPQCNSFKNQFYQCIIAEEGLLHFTVKGGGPELEQDVTIKVNQTVVQQLEGSGSFEMWLPAGFYRFFYFVHEEVSGLRISTDAIDDNGAAAMYISTDSSMYGNCFDHPTKFPREEQLCYTSYISDENLRFYIWDFFGEINWWLSARAFSSGNYRFHYDFMPEIDIDVGYNEDLYLDYKRNDYTFFRFNAQNSDLFSNINLYVMPLFEGGMANIYYNSQSCSQTSYANFPSVYRYCKRALTFPVKNKTVKLTVNFSSQGYGYFGVEALSQGEYRIMLTND